MKKILVIDDHPAVMEGIRQFWKRIRICLLIVSVLNRANSLSSSMISRHMISF